VRVLPAVDIRGGRCVNLVQGDYGQETVFAEDPVEQVRQWHAQGAGLVHIVDLDGAKQGHPCVLPQLEQVAAAGIPFQIGGGIRDMQSLDALVDTGAERVIIGTAALREPEFLAEAVQKHGAKVAVAIDAKGGRVAVAAWQHLSDAGAVPFAKQVAEAGAARIIYTDILSDGMLQGPNLDATRAVAQSVAIPVTASGGMSSIDDIHAVAKLEPFGVDEVIIGRALYVHAFTLPTAIAAAEGAA
jgi:phosphoribosylformimino-5-aminoimidazole carboxamide ribotide isomerase